jgi:hypothetical protein
MPKIIEIVVVNMHIPTNTEPMASKFPPVWTSLKTIKAINKTNTNQRNHCFTRILGINLFRLTFDNTISRNAPLGQRFQHQYLPFKKDNGRKKAIIA